MTTQKIAAAGIPLMPCRFRINRTPGSTPTALTNGNLDRNQSWLESPPPGQINVGPTIKLSAVACKSVPVIGGPLDNG